VAYRVEVGWARLDYLCAARLAPTLLPTAQHLATLGALPLTPHRAAQVATLSRATRPRLFSPCRRCAPRLPRTGPEQAHPLRQAVPLERLAWPLEGPGSWAVDRVQHSGASSAGEDGHPRPRVDLATGGSDGGAGGGRSQRAMEAGLRRSRARRPFPVRHLQPDNGAAFFNNPLVRCWGAASTGLPVSRNRPDHPHDHRIVEQPPARLGRAYRSPIRWDTPQQAAARAARDDQLGRSATCLQPVRHLSPQVVPPGTRKRTGDTAATPDPRLVGTGLRDKEGPCPRDHLDPQTHSRQRRTAL
jgi:hypothetical protein